MSALTVLPDLTGADKTMPDPGNAGAIPLTKSHATVQLSSTAAETRSLRAPPDVGFELTLSLNTDGGDVVVTSAVELNSSANTVITLNDAGDFIRLVGIKKSGTLVWRTIVNAGCTLS